MSENTSEARSGAINAAEVIEMAEALRILKTTRSTLYRWVHEGRLKAMKAGRQWRFLREDVERFLHGEKPRISMPVGGAPLEGALMEELAKAGLSRGEVERLAPSTSKDEASQMERAALLTLILADRLEASDVHVAPHVEVDGRIRVPIRFRIAGTLHAMMDLDERLLPHYMEAWKRLARMDVLDRRVAQERLATLRVGERVLSLQVSFLNSSLGESVAIRLEHGHKPRLTLEECGMRGKVLQTVRSAIHSPNGIILFTGATGSGKTTVMYAAVGELDCREAKVLSIEDSPFSHLPWVNQVGSVGEEKVPRHVLLRHALSSDPDIVVCGDVEDVETFRAAVELARTGHLVLGVLHAESAAETLVRLVDMGATPFEIEDALLLMTSQRLYRLVCPDCAKPAKPTTDELAALNRILSDGGLDPVSLRPRFRVGKGCDRCRGSGLSGRGAATEALVMSRAICEVLRKGGGVADMRQAAIAGGMVTWEAEAVRRAYAGEMSVAEALRVVRFSAAPARRSL